MFGLQQTCDTQGSTRPVSPSDAALEQMQHSATSAGVMLTVQPEHLDGFLRLAPASLPSATRDTLEEMTSWGHPSIVLTPNTHGRVLERRQGTVGMSQTD